MIGRVTTWVASGPMPLLAVTVNWYEPIFVGVPLSVPSVRA